MANVLRPIDSKLGNFRPDVVQSDEIWFQFYVYFVLQHLSLYYCMSGFLMLRLVSSVPG